MGKIHCKAYEWEPSQKLVVSLQNLDNWHICATFRLKSEREKEMAALGLLKSIFCEKVAGMGEKPPIF